MAEAETGRSYHPPRTSIIQRKVTPPLLPATVVPRPRVESLLARLIEQHRIVCVDASPGAGKTTAVRQAVRRLGRPLAWLSVDATDLATGRLLTYLAAALARARQGARPGGTRARKEPAVTQNVTLTVNGQPVTADVDERTLLLESIRDVAGCTGTHNGCLEARCGCCAVEVDGDIVKSCNVLALQVAGRSVTTIEGLSPRRPRPVEHITTEALAGVYQPLDALAADPASLHPIQAAFHHRHALQCGFCTPGMIMVLKDFLEEHPAPSRAEVRRAIAGNLCRCTGYQHIIDAAMDAAEQMRAMDRPAGPQAERMPGHHQPFQGNPA